MAFIGGYWAFGATSWGQWSAILLALLGFSQLGYLFVELLRRRDRNRMGGNNENLIERLSADLARQGEESIDLEDAFIRLFRSFKENLGFSYGELWDRNEEGPHRMVFPYFPEKEGKEQEFFDAVVLGKGHEGGLARVFALESPSVTLLEAHQVDFPAFYRNRGYVEILALTIELDEETALIYLFMSRESTGIHLQGLDALVTLSQTVLSRQYSEDLLRRNHILMSQAERLARVGNFNWHRRKDQLVCSASLYEVLQLEPGQTLDRKEDLLSLLVEEDRVALLEVLESELPEDGLEVSSLRVEASGGEVRTCALRAIPRYNRRGRSVGVLGIVRDVTDYVRQEARLEASIQELQRSNQELEQFAFVASHDLQEPLRKIRAFGERLMSKYEGEEVPGHTYVVRMEKAARRMQSLITDLLAFSRVSRDLGDKVPVDLNQVLTEVLEDLDTAITESRAVVEADHLPRLVANPLHMRQLMQNLIGNALKFAHPERTPHLRIEVHAPVSPGGDFSGDFFEIRFADNGIGFDDQYKEQIFTVFKRLHGRSEYPGTGIGLSICQKIAHNHGGTIQARGIPDKGATFSFFVPTSKILTP